MQQHVSLDGLGAGTTIPRDDDYSSSYDRVEYSDGEGGDGGDAGDGGGAGGDGDGDQYSGEDSGGDDNNGAGPAPGGDGGQ